MSATPLLAIKAYTLRPCERMVEARVLINSDTTVLNQTMRVAVIPRWWTSLGFAIGGALAYTIYDLARARRRRRRAGYAYAKVFAGCLSGVLAYALIDLDLVGIRLYSTSLAGFFLLGFLFAHLGIDALLDRLSTRRMP
jgi:hypothetical protein